MRVASRGAWRKRVALGAWAACAAWCIAAIPAGANEASRVLIADEPPFLPGTEGAWAPRRDPARRAHNGIRAYHPAPGIVVDVADDGGAVLPVLQRTARNLGYWPFRRCYEEGLRRNQALTGTVSLDLLVTPELSARRTELASSTVRDDVVTACVAREAHHLALDPVAAPVAAHLRVLLALGDEPVPGPISVPGASDLRASLRASWPDAASCFAASLARHPDAGGRIELRFDVDDDGALAHVSESGPRYPDAETSQCVAEVYRKAPLTVARAVPGKAFVYAVHFEPRSAVLPVRVAAEDETPAEDAPR